MLRRNESGSVMVVVAAAIPVLLAALAGAVEFTRAASYKQRLTSAVELACNQGAVFVTSQNAIDLTITYKPQVQDIANKKISEKSLTNTTIISDPVPLIGAKSVHTSGAGRLDYLLGKFLPSSYFEFAVVRDCSAVVNGSNSKLLISEGFKTGHNVTPQTWDVLGTLDNSSQPQGASWVSTNAGIEINGQTSVSGTSIVQGKFFAELDSDCSKGPMVGKSGCTANSSMSTKMTLTAGDYEIRYWYKQRADHPTAYNQTICADLSKAQGQARSDSVAWATADKQTYRIEAYVEKDGDSLFTMGNLVDVCVNSPTWVERKINVSIKKKADYWFRWRATDMTNSGGDTYGGLIDYIRICQGTCP